MTALLYTLAAAAYLLALYAFWGGGTNAAGEKTDPMLVIAVTGHRNIAADDAKITALVSSELKALKAAYPHHRAIVISSLAEGADRLVAQTAMKDLSARLVVPLPLPRENYGLDFETPQSRAEFDRMLARADTVIDAPIVFAGEAWKTYSEERNHQYAWIGAYAGRNADALIAIWNGKPAQGTGGTAHVVDWFKKGEAPGIYAVPAYASHRATPRLPRTLVCLNPETYEITRETIRSQTV